MPIFPNHKELDLLCLSLDDVQMLCYTRPIHVPLDSGSSQGHSALLEIDYAKYALTQVTSLVSQKTRVSTKCHVSLLMEDIFDDEEFHYTDFDTYARLDRVRVAQECS